MKRFDVCSPRLKKDGSTYWHRIGTAFEGEKGTGILLDSLPLPDKDGRVSFQLFEPRERTGSQEQNTTAKSPSRATGAPDDEIPF